MAKIFDRVNPGDLITADLMNLLQKMVESIDDRLSALETATKGSISGTVKDAATDNPITGAIIRAILGNITHTSPPTDNQGMYTITDLLPGDYLLSATAENYIYSAAQTVSVAQGIGRVANFVLMPTAGLVIVPKIFGLSLAQAKATLASSEVGLVPGDIIATHGERILPDNVEALEMIVLNQVPDAGEAVQTGSSVDIVIASQPSTQPNLRPKIHYFNPAKTPINEEVIIIGENFAREKDDNEVTFDDVKAKISPQSTITALHVTVPEIPEPPSSGEEKEVIVVVKTPTGQDSDKHIVLPPLPGDKPNITRIDTSPNPMGVVGEKIKIIGKNFADPPEDNSVFFDAIKTFPETQGSSTKQLVVEIPEIPGLIQSGDTKFVNVRVEANNRTSNVESLKVYKR